MPRLMGTDTVPAHWGALVLSGFLLGSKRPLQSPGWLPMDVPQFTISPLIPPVNGCCRGHHCLRCPHRSCEHTLYTHSAGQGAGVWQGYTCPLPLPQHPGLGHLAHPSRQALGTSSPLSAEGILLRGGERC